MPSTDSSSPKNSFAAIVGTDATSVVDSDRNSIFSAPISLPNAPHPSRANTVVSDGARSLFMHVVDSKIEKARRAASHTTPQTSLLGEGIPPTKERKTVVFMEHSNWQHFAEEDLDNALKRMVVLAIDLNKNDPSKSVEEYFAERVAKVIKSQEIKFDGKYLK